MSKKGYAYFFIREKPVKVITHLLKGESYISSIAKSVKMTYSHTLKILNILESAGIVDFKKDGKVKIARLTNRGRDIASKLDSILKSFNKL